MSRNLTAAVMTVALIAGASLSAMAADPAGQVTIFNTKDFHKDRALWTTPEYYRFNTTGQLGGMALNIVPYEDGGQVGGARLYGSKGTGVPGKTNLASPYPYKTAEEQYNDWLKKAKGGTKHTKADIPDWSGYWIPAGGGGGGGPASDTIKYLKPMYQEAMVQTLKANSEGRSWAAPCLPGGFFGFLGGEEWYVTPDKIVSLASGNANNTTRWIYTDGKGHIPKNLQFPKWGGESIGFWDGDTLIVHTNQIRGWRGGPGGEFTDDLETVEKYQRVGDRLNGEITIYDPNVFTMPVYQKMNKQINKDTKLENIRPLYNTCTDTNGPSPAVFMNKNGFLDERIPGDPGFDWDPADSRPWATAANESDKRYAAYLKAGGKPPVAADVTPPSKITEVRGRVP